MRACVCVRAFLRLVWVGVGVRRGLWVVVGVGEGLCWC